MGDDNNRLARPVGDNADVIATGYDRWAWRARVHEHAWTIALRYGIDL